MIPTAPNNESMPETPLSQPVALLCDLLELLYPDSDSVSPDILRLDDFRLRYQFTGLGPLAVAAIEQAQRITRAIGKFEDVGLCEFHIGLVYLHEKGCRGATRQFQEARQQWSFVNKTAAMRLAYLAEGIAHYHAHAYEAALKCYGKAEQMQGRIHLEPSPNSRDKFLQDLGAAVNMFQKDARLALHKQTTPVASPPEVAEGETAVENGTAHPSPTFPTPQPPGQLTTPIPAHINTHGHYLWYRIHIQRQDKLFAEIKEHGWLLVNTQAGDHAFEKGDLVVIASDNQDASVTLEPHLPDSQTFQRIYLARTKFEGRFSREAGHVQLSSEIEKIPETREDILGFVIGWWFEAEKPETVEG